MQSVSQDWKDNQEKILANESYVEISFKVTDPDAYEDASATDNSHVSFADTNYIVSEVDKNIRPYATLEMNQFVLDGGRDILPNSNYGEVGFVGGAISSANKTYSTNPIVTINFTKVHSNMLQGVTIKWSEFLGEYAEEFKVSAYNGNTLVASKTVTGNESVLSVVNVDIINYNKITIEVVKWSIANRRARIDEVFIGINKIYSKKDIFSYSCSQTVDPISASLPTSDISFSLNNVDNSYNPQNAEGLSKYLVERQSVTVRYGYKLDDGNIEWIKGGTYYLSEWDTEQNGLEANFKARDLLEFMTGTYYLGVYNANGTSLYDLALSVLQDADLPLNSDGSVKWVIDDSLKNITTVAPLPIDTHANCLQMIANAGECVIYQDRKNVLHIEPLASGETNDYTISKFNSYSKPGVTLSKPLKQVEVPFNSYAVANELSYMFEGTVTVNGATELLITYSSAATNVKASVVSGGTLNSATYYSNACILNITGTGTVSLQVYGNALTVSSVNTIVSSSDSGETISVSNPLITDHNRAMSVGRWVESYRKNRMVLDLSWRADPRLDALDIVDNENDYTTNKVIMTDVKYSYKGAFRGSGEGRVI